MEEKEFKYGVYIKPNGKLVLLDNGGPNGKYHLLAGAKSNNPYIRLVFPRFKDRPDIGWCGETIGWGPTAYLNKCEYLGDL